MCGLLGYFTLSQRDECYRWMGRNIDVLSHRGPDERGTWSTPEFDVGLAHRRLSIIDVSDQAKQPMSTAEGDVILVYNGNIYNYIELRKELQDVGVSFRSRSDTEVFLKAYRVWGDGFVDRLFGFFAFAIWDERKRRMLLGRDRLGEKPLYYMCDTGRLYFASEPHVLPKDKIDHSALADFLVYGFVPSPKTVWSNVRKIEPAHLLSVEIGRDGLKTQYWRYWQPSIGHSRLRSQEDIVDGLEQLCREAAERTTRSDVPFGCLLSGGVDSSGVVSFISQEISQPLHTYTVGFGFPGKDELSWAKKVAERYQTIHREILCRTDNALTFFPQMSRIYGEPFDDTSQVACVRVFEAAAQYCKVVLTGDGADELFCGYSKHTHLKRLLLLRKPFPSWLWRGVLGILHDRLRPGTLAEVELYRAMASNRELMCELSANGVRPRELRDLMTPDLADYDPRHHIEKRLRDVQEKSPLDQLRYLDMVFKLPEQMLYKVDRASMAASVEARAFYLYHPLVEFVLSLPTEMLIRRGGKWFLKLLLERYIPKKNLYRRKQGFGLQRTKYKTWFDQSMKRYVKDTVGIDYESLLVGRHEGRSKRLFFGARSLYEWLNCTNIGETFNE